MVVEVEEELMRRHHLEERDEKVLSKPLLGRDRVEAGDEVFQSSHREEALLQIKFRAEGCNWCNR